MMEVLEGNMEIVQKSVKSLIPYVNNARTHTKAQVKQIAKSIKEFGFTNPVLIDPDDGIIAGHGRVKAAESLGMDEVPCIVLSGLSEKQKRAYIIADNKIALNAGWDDSLLKLEIRELMQDEFDLDLIGFSNDEVAGLLTVEEQEEAEDGTEKFAEALEIENNYIVLKFHNEVDWLQAQTVFGLEQVTALSTRKDGVLTKGMRRVGMGRVVDGAMALNRIVGV